MDSWLADVWGKKLGIHFSYCKMIQKGLSVLFLKNHEIQARVINKQFWGIGKNVFRALAWSHDALNEKILALSSPRWMVVRIVPPQVWNFIPLLLEPMVECSK